MLLTAACGASSKPTALQSYVAKHYNVRLSALPPHPTTISAHQAEDLASASFSERHRTTAAGLWRVTNPELYIPEHGIHRLLVNNQVAWIVLVHGVNITGVCDLCETQPKPVLGTEAVLVNAESGKRTGAWPLPARIH